MTTDVPTLEGTSPKFTRRSLLRLSGIWLGAGTTAAALGALYALRLEPEWIQISHRDIALPGLKRAHDGLRIAHLSDIHLGRHVEPRLVRRAVRMVNDLAPDLVILTGDFVSGTADYSQTYRQLFRTLYAHHGIYAVLGNHDIWTDGNQVASNLRQSGVIVLRNECTAVTIGGQRLWLVGLEDRGDPGFVASSFQAFGKLWQGNIRLLDRLLADLPGNETRLLLVHNPDVNELLDHQRVDLALCGHTHGGQLRLPLLGALLIPSCLGEKYAQGLVEGPVSPVFVNRGLGTSGIPIRFNCRPEISLLRLRSA